MALIPVNFEYRTGLRKVFVLSARLGGGWDATGRVAENWTFLPMEAFTADDGCPAFRATVQLDDSQIGQTFNWGVTISTAGRADVWGIVAEVNSATSTARHCSFTLRGGGETARYFLTHCRRLGANRLLRDGQPDSIRFSCWAPNAHVPDHSRRRFDRLSYGPLLALPDRHRWQEPGSAAAW